MGAAAAIMQIIMFDKHPLEHNNPQQQQQQQHGISGSSAVSRAAAVQSHQQFVAELVHLISLLHAVACAALRRDPDLGNLTRHRYSTTITESESGFLTELRHLVYLCVALHQVPWSQLQHLSVSVMCCQLATGMLPCEIVNTNTCLPASLCWESQRLYSVGLLPTLVLLLLPLLLLLQSPEFCTPK